MKNEHIIQGTNLSLSFKLLVFGILIFAYAQNALGIVVCCTESKVTISGALWEIRACQTNPTNIAPDANPKMCSEAYAVASASGINNTASINVGDTGCKYDETIMPPNTNNVNFTYYFHIYDPLRSGTVTITSTPGTPCGSTPNSAAKGTLEVDVGSSGGGGGGGGPRNCPSCGSVGASSLGAAVCDNNSADFRLYLGPASSIETAGYLWIEATTPSTNLAGPQSLTLPLSWTNVDVITNVSGVIQQVLVPQGLVNVAVVNSYEYYLQCFYVTNVTAKNGGLYGTNAPAFVTWTVQNPDGATASNRLWITEQRGGNSRLFQYTFNSVSNAWDLLQPDGQTTLSTWNIVNATNSYITNYFRQVSVAGQVLSLDTKTYQYVPAISNSLLLQEINGSGATSETTTYNYYTSDPGLNHLQMVTYPHGNWSYYTYDDNERIVKEYTPYGNCAPPTAGVEPDPSTCRLTQYAYSLTNAVDGIDDAGDTNNPWAYRKITVSVFSHEVARTYHLSHTGYDQTQVCPNPGGHWNDNSNLIETTFSYVSGGYTAGRPYDVFNRDGTETVYAYPDPFTTITTDAAGYQMTNIVDSWGITLSQTLIDSSSSIMLKQTTYTYTNSSGTYYDQLRRSHDVTDLAGRTTHYSYDCCNLDSMVDSDGVTTEYAYDALKRQVASTIFRGGTSGVTTTNILDGISQVLATERIGTDNSIITLQQSQYDLLGRVICQTNALGGVTITTNVIVNNQLCVTNIYPGGGTRVEVYYQDGRLQSVSGTAAHPVQYIYGVDQDGASGPWRQFTLEIKPDANGGTNEWIKTYYDGAGHAYKTVYASASQPYPCSQSFYNNLGQVWMGVDPDGVATLYQYNAKGELAYTAVDINQSGSIDFNGNDRITWTTNDVTTDHGMNVRRTRTYVWGTPNTDSSNLVSVSETSANDLNTWQIFYGNANTPVTNSTTISPGSSRTEISVAPDGSYAVNTFSYGQLQSTTRYNSTNSQIGSTTYGYDAHGRQNTISDARNGTTTLGFNNADLVATNTTPNPGGGSPEVTVTAYDNLLRPVGVTQPDLTTVSNVYLLTGELGLQFGSRIYSAGYGYDYAGRMKTMTNWSNYSGGTGPRVTTWNYDGYRGWLTNKTYDGNTAGPIYSNTPAGRLAKRTWARMVGGQPLVTGYLYDNAGSLTNVWYSDSTPGVTNVYDRLGRLSIASWTNITETLAYNLANELLSETYSGGTLDGLSVTNGYDQYLHRTNLTALASGVLNRAIYAYDNASRLSIVTDPINNNSASYGYLANSMLVSNITFNQSGTTRMTTAKQYDFLNRLTQISSAPNAVYILPLTYNYNYNPANQRTKDTLADGSYWIYQYDILGQVTNGVKYFNDGTLVPGQQFGYLFDDIGNRKQTTAGGDSSGANLRLASYMVNNLNQISQRDYPGTNDIIGASILSNSVSVNSQTAWRKGEYFQATVKSNNTAAAQWEGVSVVTGSFTNTGSLFVPKTPEQFSYDPDGNLTNDGHWAYTWDAENRLVQMTTNSVSAGPQYKLSFAYDPQGRRIQKLVSTNNGSAYIPQYTNRFLYDGWNLIAEVNPSGSLIRGYMWGTDLSGSQQGAGGVSGLLEVSYHGTTTTNCFPAFDGNGNVMALINAANETVVANYDYGPFGEVIRASGPMARVNPIRFSTKYQDDESDLLYYGYRYYKPSTGTWPNKDPMGERGGINLYGFVKNNPINLIDKDGKQYNPFPPPPERPPVYEPPQTPFPPSILKKYDCSCCGEQEMNDGLNDLENRYSAAATYVNDKGLIPDADDNSPGKASCYKSNAAILSFMEPTPRCWICFMDRAYDHWIGGYDENFIHCYTMNKGGKRKEVIFDWYDSKEYGGDGVNTDIDAYKSRHPYQAPQYPSLPIYSDCSKPSKEWKGDNGRLDSLFTQAN